MNKTLFTLLSIMASILVFSCSEDSPTEVEKVISGDVTLSSQAEVNSFKGTSITGWLTISGADITDLSPLKTLTSIGFELRLQDSYSLTNLDGLSNLASVGNIYLYNNYSLTNLDGLSRITSSKRIVILSNLSLTNLDGLSNITSPEPYLRIRGNFSLNSFCGLYPLLSSNAMIENYDVLDNLVNPTPQQIIDDGPCAP